MYFTAGGEASAEISVKHSKFLAFCARVESEDEAEDFVKGIKKRFTDATHAPYAYLLGEKTCLCDGFFSCFDGGVLHGDNGVHHLRDEVREAHAYES